MEMLVGPFKKARQIIETIEQFHHEAYFVGGSVRNLLINKEVNDIDIATSASPEEIKQMFKHVIPVGIEHGTVLVRYQGESYEVTTFRVNRDEVCHDELETVNNLKEDLKRRDFTINALAMDKNGKVIDLFNSKNDLLNKVIRAVGEADERFLEDPLRIVRALRFSSELGFSIEQNTLNKMIHLKDRIENVAIERITTEMTKFFQGEYINNGFHYLKKTSVFAFLPIMKEHPIIEKLPTPLKPFKSFAEVICLFHYVYPNVTIRQFVKKWKCSNKIYKEAENLFDALKYYETKGYDSLLVYRLNKDSFHGFCRLVELLFPSKLINMNDLNKVYNSLPIKSRHEIDFNGKSLLTLFPKYRKGPWIRQMIEQIEIEIVLNNLNNKYDDIEEWVLCNPPEVS